MKILIDQVIDNEIIENIIEWNQHVLLVKSSFVEVCNLRDELEFIKLNSFHFTNKIISSKIRNNSLFVLLDNSDIIELDDTLHVLNKFKCKIDRVRDFDFKENEFIYYNYETIQYETLVKVDGIIVSVCWLNDGYKCIVLNTNTYFIYENDRLLCSVDGPLLQITPKLMVSKEKLYYYTDELHAMQNYNEIICVGLDYSYSERAVYLSNSFDFIYLFSTSHFIYKCFHLKNTIIAIDDFNNLYFYEKSLKTLSVIKSKKLLSANEDMVNSVHSIEKLKYAHQTSLFSIDMPFLVDILYSFECLMLVFIDHSILFNLVSKEHVLFKFLVINFYVDQKAVVIVTENYILFNEDQIMHETVCSCFYENLLVIVNMTTLAIYDISSVTLVAEISLGTIQPSCLFAFAACNCIRVILSTYNNVLRVYEYVAGDITFANQIDISCVIHSICSFRYSLLLGSREGSLLEYSPAQGIITNTTNLGEGPVNVCWGANCALICSDHNWLATIDKNVSKFELALVEFTKPINKAIWNGSEFIGASAKYLTALSIAPKASFIFNQIYTREDLIKHFCVFHNDLILSSTNQFQSHLINTTTRACYTIQEQIYCLDVWNRDEQSYLCIGTSNALVLLEKEFCFVSSQPFPFNVYAAASMNKHIVVASGNQLFLLMIDSNIKKLIQLHSVDLKWNVRNLKISNSLVFVGSQKDSILVYQIEEDKLVFVDADSIPKFTLDFVQTNHGFLCSDVVGSVYALNDKLNCTMVFNLHDPICQLVRGFVKQSVPLLNPDSNGWIAYAFSGNVYQIVELTDNEFEILQNVQDRCVQKEHYGVNLPLWRSSFQRSKNVIDGALLRRSISKGKVSIDGSCKTIVDRILQCC